MNEFISLQLDECKESMTKAVAHTETELTKIRAGKASPGMLDGIYVDYYGTSTPLAQVANVNTPDATLGKTHVICDRKSNHGL